MHFADDIGKRDGKQIAIVRVRHDHRFTLDYQLHIWRYRAECFSNQLHGEHDADQRNRGPGREWGVSRFVNDHQPADNRMPHPGNGKGRRHVRRAEHTHRTIGVSILCYIIFCIPWSEQNNFQSYPFSTFC